MPYVQNRLRTSPNDTEMIPKKIHHIYFNWHGEDLIPNYTNESHDLTRTEIYSKCLHASHLINHDYEHTLWSEEDCSTLIAEHFPNEEEFYHSMRYDIQRVDFMKFCIPYVHGGIYVDLDIFPLRKYDRILDRDFLMYNMSDDFIQQDFIASAPKNPIWKLLIGKIVENYKEKEKIEIYEKWKGRFVLQTTGPRFVTRFFKTHFKDYTPERNIIWGRCSEKGGQDKTKCIGLNYYAGGWLPKQKKTWCAE